MIFADSEILDRLVSRWRAAFQRYYYYLNFDLQNTVPDAFMKNRTQITTRINFRMKVEIGDVKSFVSFFEHCVSVLKLELSIHYTYMFNVYLNTLWLEVFILGLTFA